MPRSEIEKFEPLMKEYAAQALEKAVQSANLLRTAENKDSLGGYYHAIKMVGISTPRARWNRSLVVGRAKFNPFLFERLT